MNTPSLEIYYSYLKLHHPTTIDIREHLDTLRDLARGLDHVTEMGFRSGTSFTAFLMAQPKKLISYDLHIPPQALSIFNEMRGETEIELIEKNTISFEIAPTDLLFIDTLHTYDQLRTELYLHAKHVKKYIAFHDTETFGLKGENGKEPGLLKAIEELISEGEWKIKNRYLNNNGLMVLERTKVS